MDLLEHVRNNNYVQKNIQRKIEMVLVKTRVRCEKSHITVNICA